MALLHPSSPPPPSTALSHSHPKFPSLVDQPEVEDLGGDPWRDWEYLPPELLNLILSRLQLRDLIRSSIACKAWLQAASEAYQPQQPWFGVMDTRQFYSISEERFYTLPPLPKDLASHELSGTYEDWLILTPLPCNRTPEDDNFCCCLYNPFSTSRISFPAPPVYYYDDEAPLMVLSSSPSHPNCIAAFVSHIAPFSTLEAEIGVCLLSTNEMHWRLIPCPSRVRHIAFFNDFLYAISGAGALYSVDTQSLEIIRLISVPAKPPLPLWIHRRTQVLNRRRRCYQLLAFAGQLMMVCFVPHCGLVPFAVFKAEFELKRWDVVDNLNGQAIYCDNAGGFTPMKPVKSLGIEGDCIYPMGTRTRLCEMVVPLSRQDMNDSPLYKPIPRIWLHLMSPGSFHCFLTPKPTFRNPGLIS